MTEEINGVKVLEQIPELSTAPPGYTRLGFRLEIDGFGAICEQDVEARLLADRPAFEQFVGTMMRHRLECKIKEARRLAPIQAKIDKATICYGTLAVLTSGYPEAKLLKATRAGGSMEQWVEFHDVTHEEFRLMQFECAADLHQYQNLDNYDDTTESEVAADLEERFKFPLLAVVV